jgi:hypothetical protein
MDKLMNERKLDIEIAFEHFDFRNEPGSSIAIRFIDKRKGFYKLVKFKRIEQNVMNPENISNRQILKTLE